MHKDALDFPNNPAIWKPLMHGLSSTKRLCRSDHRWNSREHLQPCQRELLLLGIKPHIHKCFLFFQTPCPSSAHQACILQNVSPTGSCLQIQVTFLTLTFREMPAKAVVIWGRTSLEGKYTADYHQEGENIFFPVKMLPVSYIFKQISVFSLGLGSCGWH